MGRPVTGVEDLVTWLRAAYDDVEQVAQEAIREHSDPTGRWRLGGDGGDDVLPDDPTGNDWVAVGPFGGGLGHGTAAHIVRWDPARVLAEVEAKRRILDEVKPQIDSMDGQIESEWGSGVCEPTGESDLLVKLLAQPYAGRHGWREEWRA